MTYNIYLPDTVDPLRRSAISGQNGGYFHPSHPDVQVDVVSLTTTIFGNYTQLYARNYHVQDDGLDRVSIAVVGWMGC